MTLAVTPAELRGAWQSLETAEQRLAEAIAQATKSQYRSLASGPRMSTPLSTVRRRNPRRFHATMSGVSGLEETMLECGMIIDGGRRPDFPDYDKDWAQDSPELAAYHRDMEYVLAFHPEGETGIPWWKLSSNDGWHVTALECDQALGLWQASGLRSEQEPWGTPGMSWENHLFLADWLVFLSVGASTDGFIVE